MSYERTSEHRRLRAELIRQWRPWEQSTGPRTEQGKIVSAGNSEKHGQRSRAVREELRQLRAYLRLCAQEGTAET